MVAEAYEDDVIESKALDLCGDIEVAALVAPEYWPLFLSALPRDAARAFAVIMRS
jgi:hypothetical protein